MKPMLVILLVLSCCVNVLLFVRYSRSAAGVESLRDTVRETRVDTVVCEKPVARDSIVVRYVAKRLPALHDTVGLLVADNTDSTDVVVPIMQKRYADSTYTAWVSGYCASLDSIHVYPRHELMRITNTVVRKPKRWGLGIGVGCGITPGKGVQPYIGVGVNYNILYF